MLLNCIKISCISLVFLGGGQTIKIIKVIVPQSNGWSSGGGSGWKSGGSGWKSGGSGWSSGNAWPSSGWQNQGINTGGWPSGGGGGWPSGGGGGWSSGGGGGIWG